MPGLFDKINTLLRARVESFLEDDLRLPHHRDRRGLLAADQLGGNIDAEIAALRQQIEDAITYEEQLQAEISTLLDQAADWDARADNALLEEDESTARQAVAGLKRLRQQIAMREADLAQHRRTTAEFIERVNMLEGLVAETRRQPAAATPDTVDTPPTLENIIQTARQEVATLRTTEAALAADAAPEQPADPEPVPNSSSADDNLAARRARLSRPTPKQEE